MPEAARARRGHRVLATDVGGTYVRFALACDGVLLGEPVCLERAGFPDLAAACRHWIDRQAEGPRIDGAVVAAAGRLEHGRIAMTNAAWSIDPGPLAAALGVPPRRLTVLNDFEALAWALPALGDDALCPVPGGAARRAGDAAPQRGAGHRAIVGPGSGLGVAALLRTPRGWLPVATEGGHASCAPDTPLERAAEALAIQRYGRASWERLLSGPGLALLHEAACAQHGPAMPPIDAAAVLRASAAGDDRARQAVQAFVGLLGAFAGDLALLYGATGGVVIAGGIVPRIAEQITLEGMRERFEAKGRFEKWLQHVALDRLIDPFAALRGAANAYVAGPAPAPGAG
jgi:glucokinase